MTPLILASARRHGVTDEQMRHVFRNPIRVLELDDLTMLIGADQSGRLLEVGVVSDGWRELIVHAMPARPKFLEH